MTYNAGAARLRRALLIVAGVMLVVRVEAFVLPGGAVPHQSLPAGTPHRVCFETSAQRHDVPAVLLAAVARVESAFNPRAVSNKDAVGVMQIRWPLTARHLGITRRSELFDPCVSIDAGARYLRELFNQFGVTELALGAYNMGPSRIEAAGRALPRAGREYVGLVNRALARLGQGGRAGSAGTAERGRVIEFRMPTRERAQATVRALERRGTVRAWIRAEGAGYVVVVEG